jgi:C-terminal processing protease CtpA/Prc
MALSQSFDATAYRDKSVRLRGKLRAADHGKARIWLRVDRGETSTFFENMLRRPVTSSEWTNVELAGPIASDATRIVIGVLVFEVGKSWYDDLELSVQGADGRRQRIDIPDGGFEESTLLEHWHPGTARSGRSASTDGWVVAIDRERPSSGAAALRIEPVTKASSEELFLEAPRPGETVDVDLGCGLRARVPISLYSRSGHTIGDESRSPYRSARSANVSAAVSKGFDHLAAAADVIVIWNVLRHFWPYWNFATVDWNVELDTALADALADRNVDDHVATLQRLSAALPDGHATTHCSGEHKLSPPPFALDEVEGSVVAIASEDKAVERGDVIVAIDGEAVSLALTREEKKISGSPQWRRIGALGQLGYGSPGSTMHLVIRRGAAELAIDVSRGEHVVSPSPMYAAIERLDDGIYYVDLTRASMADIDAVMAELARAPGVVFDVRGYPNGNHRILSHLLAVPATTKWGAAPRIIRPNSAATPSAWAWDGWNLPAVDPHIGGRVAFLTGPRAFSYSESIMGLVEYYHLGEIIGGVTAGSNGEVAQISTPMGCDTTFTGRLITKLDGSRHYLTGFSPTVTATPTIAGVAAGRDEVLERALEYVRNGSH